MSAQPPNFMSRAQRQKIAEAVNHAAEARRRANSATRSLTKMLAGFAKSDKDATERQAKPARRRPAPSRAF